MPAIYFTLKLWLQNHIVMILTRAANQNANHTLTPYCRRLSHSSCLSRYSIFHLLRMRCNISSIKKRMFPHYFISKYRRAISTMSKTKKSDRANAQPQKVIMIKQCRQMQWAQVLNLSGTARFLVKSLLWKADSLRRTNISTCAALSAHVRIDRILFSLWDCANRALVNTCTACDTIVTNYVSHS